MGNKLVLRCGTEAELNDWLETLKRTATIEPVPGTLTREGSLKKRTKVRPPIRLGDILIPLSYMSCYF